MWSYNCLKACFTMSKNTWNFRLVSEGESSNGPAEVRDWELTLLASLSLGLQLRSVSYWRALTAQSPDDRHLYPQWDVSSGPWEKDQGDAVRAIVGPSTGAEVGGSLLLIIVLLLVVFLWNALWRAFAVMMKGTLAGNNIKLGSGWRGFWDFRVKPLAWRLRGRLIWN